MKLRQALEEKQLDVRLRDRLVAEGKLTKETLQKMVKQLPDDAANAVSLDQSEDRTRQ